MRGRLRRSRSGFAENAKPEYNKRNTRKNKMTTAICTAPLRTKWKRILHVLMSLLVLFMAAVFLTGCKKGRAEWKKGVASMQEEEYENAVKHFKESAGKGNTDARIMLALCYAIGMGADQDVEKAGKQLGKAAETGDPIAQAAYGAYLRIQLEQGREYNEKDLEKAINYLKKSADQDCVFGQLALGMTYLISDDEDMNGKGIKLLKKVAAMPKSKKKIFLDEVKKSIWEYVVDEEFSDLSDDETASELVDAVSKVLDSDELTVSDMAIIMSQGMLFTYYVDRKKDFDEAEKWLNKAKKSGLPKIIYNMAQEELEKAESRAKRRYSDYDDYDW